MSTEQDVTETACGDLLSRLGEDPLSPLMPERVRLAVEAGCPPGEIAQAVWTGLDGALAVYWVALQEGKLVSDDGDLYRVVGMRRHVRTCYRDTDRLLEFANQPPDYFEMLGRMTSWLH